MKIDFLSVYPQGNYIIYEVSPGKEQKSQGSFVICSVDKVDLDFQAELTGTIKGPAIELNANGMTHLLRIGKKSINQLRLWQLGYHIPHTIVLDFTLSDQFKLKEELDLKGLYEELIPPKLGTHVAVRCSSNLEDGDAQSFAGTFDTYLNIPNQLDEIQGKIIQSYRKFCLRKDIQEDVFQTNTQLGIMIQEMIRPKFSGFLFTLDPVNPPSDWLKIEYWQGPRENSDGYSITLNRETGKRVSSGRDNSQAPLPITVQEKLHLVTLELEHYFSTPQDVEFLVFDTEDAADVLYLVQSRPITAFSFSPDKVRVDEQQKLTAIQDQNWKLYDQNPVLSNTNVAELLPRAIPLSYSIFKYGFAGTSKLDGGISIGRSRLGYAGLDPEDRGHLFYTVADQARTNLIVDALTFRLPGISKRDYIDIFVKHYLQKVKQNSEAAHYPEDGLYLQSDDPELWFEMAGTQGEHFRTEFVEFLDQIIHIHAPREYQRAGNFFQGSDILYRSFLDRDLYSISSENLRLEIDEILTYLRTTFCPQYVVYARLAFLCTHVAKMSFRKGSRDSFNQLLGLQEHFTDEQVLNELMSRVKIPADLEGPQYPQFELLYKLGRVPLAEFLFRFQHLGSIDIAQPRLGDYLHDELIRVFGQSNKYGLNVELPNTNHLNYADIDITRLGISNISEFQAFYTYAGQFMRLREKAKSELLKLLWILKRRFIELARQFSFGNLIYYLELDEVFTLSSDKRDELRMLALQRKAYFDACQQHRVKDVLVDLTTTPLEKISTFDTTNNNSLYKFAHGEAIFHGYAEGYCLTASSNDEFIVKLAAYRARNIEKIVGVFKGIELSYFNLSALVGFTTENGGFLSHAATIAREFRLPYISGIKFDQFRDDDYLIIDTENDQVIIR